MKYQKTIAVLAGLAFAGAFSQAQIAIGENLTVSGFVDASYTDTETGTNDSVGIDVNEVEIDFAFSYEGVSAEVHLESEGGSVALEQAFVTTDLSGITISAGRMLNLLGFEADEPTGLYQVSKAYSDNTDDDYNPGSRYNDGVRGSFSQGDWSIAASVTDNVYAADGLGGDSEDVAFDVLVTYSGIENLSLAAGYGDEGDTDLTALISQIFNIYASYSFGQLIIAGEYNDFENGAATAVDGDSYLVLANYTINDDLSLTVRHSEVDSGVAATDREKTTVALNYAVNDNLSTVIEYSTGESGNAAGTAQEDNDSLGIKGLFSF